MNNLSGVANLMRQNSEFIRMTVESFDSSAVRSHVAEDSFCVLEHICHLRDLERDGFRPRLTDMLNADDPRLLEFDGDAVARASNYMAQDAPEALREFLRLRQNNAALIESAPESALRRIGHYEDGRRTDFADVLRRVFSHDADHVGRLMLLRSRLSIGVGS